MVVVSPRQSTKFHRICMSPTPGGYFYIRRLGGLAPNFASEIFVEAPNFASKNINDKYPKFCPLNFRYDPKIGTFSQLLRLLVTELPRFFLLFCELGRTLPQILPPNLMWGPRPPTSLFGSTPLGRQLTNYFKAYSRRPRNLGLKSDSL